ncbi:hypothetical protein OESDEN_07682 [Oesophagostomum dentatum]|uniref:Uncharacterized protein n=1 Tax=Oesophagostomum dentatum TaxID=61180 RepID=A0A0B1T4B7_OESDE|nr:hypothetical protein OESDEN_07682 [Oesophagostomum dentatum]
MGDTLASIGTGLFQTHISWTDIEQCIEEEKKIKVHFGPRKSAYQIGSGNGFLSRIGVIEADFQDETLELPQKYGKGTYFSYLKVRFVLKVLSFLEGIEYGELVAEREGMDLEEIFAGFDEQARIVSELRLQDARARDLIIHFSSICLKLFISNVL